MGKYLILFLLLQACGDPDRLKFADASVWNEYETSAMIEGTKEVSYIAYGDYVDDLLGSTIAVTIDNYILLGSGYFELDSCHRRQTMAHESVHVSQYDNDGFYAFSQSYFQDYIAGRAAGLDERDSYLSIKYEQEATKYERRYTCP